MQDDESQEGQYSPIAYSEMHRIERAIRLSVIFAIRLL